MRFTKTLRHIFLQLSEFLIGKVPMKDEKIYKNSKSEARKSHPEAKIPQVIVSQISKKTENLSDTKVLPLQLLNRQKINHLKCTL
jgi:hypothetical protein